MSVRSSLRDDVHSWVCAEPQEWQSIRSPSLHYAKAFYCSDENLCIILASDVCVRYESTKARIHVVTNARTHERTDLLAQRCAAGGCGAIGYGITDHSRFIGEEASNA